MKALWARREKAAAQTGLGQYVKRTELPELVRRIVADAMTRHIVIVPQKAPPPSTEEIAGPTKHPRAAGHVHRGRCGVKCFDGRRKA